MERYAQKEAGVQKLLSMVHTAIMLRLTSPMPSGRQAIPNNL